MKIAFGQAYFISNSKGGTEQYTYLLLRELIALGHEVYVFTFSNTASEFNFEGIQVHQEVPAGESNKHTFAAWLKKVNPDVYHQHTLTPEMDYHFLQVAKEAGIHTAITFHLASATCIRGSMVLFGIKPCDGKLSEYRCTSCYMQKQGYAKISQIFFPFFISILTRILPRKFLPPSFFVYQNKKNQVKKILRFADKILVFSDWQERLLLRNSVDGNKIAKVDHAILGTEALSQRAVNQNSILTIGYSGRMTLDKGLHVLLLAIKRLNNPNVKLLVNGIPDSKEISYYRNLLSDSESMNVQWMVNSNEENFYSKIDLLCVPSQVLETGPLVIYEALTQHRPILGSNIGGIAEKVKQFKAGWTFQFNDISDLMSKIQDIYLQRSLSPVINFSKDSIPNYGKSAFEMQKLYYELQGR